jgi:Phage Tail Collar Domain
MKKLQAPNPFFLDANGDSLDAGYVFVGTAGANAETNQLTVYWDEAGTQPAAQPLRTSNGYIVNGVTRARAFVNADDFSMIVKNRHGVVVDSSLTNEETMISGAMAPVVSATTLALARTDMGVAASGANNDITSLGALATIPTVIADEFTDVRSEIGAIIPAGLVGYFARNTAPTGWMKANGAAVSRTTYSALFASTGTAFGAGDGVSTFNLPDLRGEFIRGLDDGRGVDSGRVIGSAQGDQNKSHGHSITDSGMLFVRSGSGGQGVSLGTSFTGNNNYPTLSVEGGSEARPRNVALLGCIKY